MTPEQETHLQKEICDHFSPHYPTNLKLLRAALAPFLHDNAHD